MKFSIPALLIGLLLISFSSANAQSNKIYLVSKANNYTTYKLPGFSFWNRMIWYRVNTGNETIKGLVRFNDSTMEINGQTIEYSNIYSIEYSGYTKFTNKLGIVTNLLFAGISSYYVINYQPGSIESNLGIIIGIPSLIGAGVNIYEVSKPAVYILEDYHIRTKKGS